MYQFNKIDFFGKDAEFDHVGIAVKSIEDTLKNARKILDSVQKAYIALVNVHNFKIELVEPLNESSPAAGVLKKGLGIYHVCFKVEDIQKAIKEARENGFHCITKPTSAKAFDGREIAWLFNKNYGLIELLEK